MASQVVVLSFWFTACGPCVETIPILRAVAGRHAEDERVALLAPALDQAEALGSFLARNPLDWRVLPGAGGLAEALGVRAHPTILVAGRDGCVAWAAVGCRPDIEASLEGAIRQALEQPAPPAPAPDG